LPTYLRLCDKVTGHQWDACLEAARGYLATGGVEIVTRYPPRRASRPRPAKPFRSLRNLTSAHPRRRPTAEPIDKE
jgi:hypothetical protein